MRKLSGDGWTRTTDARRMKALLYRLSYTAKVFEFRGMPGGTRTPDQWLWRPPLCR